MSHEGNGASEPVRGPGADATPRGSGVAVVLAGAGARGAYEAGALSVILPALGADQPEIYVGSSAGAINALGFASFSHLDPATASAKVLDLWRSIGRSDVFSPPVAGLLRAAVHRTIPRRGAQHRPVGLLDTAPLYATLGGLLNWDQLHVNIRHGHVGACGVVVTSRSTHGSKVFLESRPSMGVPDDDPIRRIAFSPSTLRPTHVVGSSSIPALFPPVGIAEPCGDTDWCVDGGVRLNTPIKPALMLGARRVVVVTTAPVSVPAPAEHPLDHPPGLASGLIDILRAVTVDPMVEDLRSLVHDNCRAAQLPSAKRPHGWPRTIEYVFAGPRRADALGELAGRVVGSGRRWSPSGLIGRAIAGSPDLGELASHVLFRRDFISQAIELGRRDAGAHLHRGSLVWQTTTLPA